MGSLLMAGERGERTEARSSEVGSLSPLYSHGVLLARLNSIGLHVSSVRHPPYSSLPIYSLVVQKRASLASGRLAFSEGERMQWAQVGCESGTACIGCIGAAMRRFALDVVRIQLQPLMASGYVHSKSDLFPHLFASAKKKKKK